MLFGFIFFLFLFLFIFIHFITTIRNKMQSGRKCKESGVWKWVAEKQVVQTGPWNLCEKSKTHDEDDMDNNGDEDDSPNDCLDDDCSATITGDCKWVVTTSSSSTG